LPAELLEQGLGRSRLVLMNEAHHGWTHCPRTRAVGLALLPVAHRLGVRHLAMEALGRPVAERANATRSLGDDEFGYLGQPDMRALVDAALDLGWMLHAYEDETPEAPFDDWNTQESINWREDQQARNLGAVVAGLSSTARVFVWCGGGHLLRKPYEVALRPDEPGVWIPMGSLVESYGGVQPFAIDQNVSVAFGGFERAWLEPRRETLREHGGTAGFLAEDMPEDIAEWQGGQVADAYLLSLDNAMTETASA
jgi:hypothetical protein